MNANRKRPPIWFLIVMPTLIVALLWEAGIIHRPVKPNQVWGHINYSFPHFKTNSWTIISVADGVAVCKYRDGDTGSQIGCVTDIRRLVTKERLIEDLKLSQTVKKN